MFSKLVTVFGVCLLLAGCGGSSDNDNGTGTSNSGLALPTSAASNTDSSSDFAGTYNGTISITVSAAGQSESFTDPITIVIDAAGNVTLTGSDGSTGTSPLSGNSFSDALALMETIDGAECSISLTVSGTVNGDTISGPISGDASCSEAGLTINADVSGSFTANR